MDVESRYSYGTRHPDPKSPTHAFWDNRGFLPLYEKLESFTERVTWLKDVGYEGQMVYGYGRRDEGGYGRLKGPEEIVKGRAKAENGAPDKVERDVELWEKSWQTGLGGFLAAVGQLNLQMAKKGSSSG